MTVRCIRVADFDKEGSQIHDLNPTQRTYPPETLKWQGLSYGDFLIEKSGGGPTSPVGNVVMYEGSGGEMYSNFTARIIPSKAVDALYALYLHRSLYLTRVTSRSVKQSTGIQNLDMGSYLDETIYLPPLKMQIEIAREIAAERQHLDTLRSDALKAIQLAQERRHALITAAVTGQLNVSQQRRLVTGELEDEVLQNA